MSRLHHRIVRRYAHIAIAEDAPTMPCIVMDLSETEARLVVAPAAELPDAFMLLLAADGAVERHCRVVWRDEVEVGVDLSRPKCRLRLAMPPAQRAADDESACQTHLRLAGRFRPGTL